MQAALGKLLLPDSDSSTDGSPPESATPNTDKLFSVYGRSKPPAQMLKGARLPDRYVMAAHPGTAYSPLEIPKNLVSRNRELGLLVERSEIGKRKVSELSGGRGNVDCESFLDGQLDYLRDEEDVYAKVREQYHNMYREGSISKQDLTRLISASEAKRNVLLREKGALLGERRKISEVFFEAIQDQKVGIDQAYSDALSFALGPVYNATLNVPGQRSKGQQDQWRNAVRTYLDAWCKEKGKEDWIWCSITRGYHRGGQREKDSNMKTAHIIPRKLPGKLVKALMGRQHELEDGQDIIWDAKNGIPMLKEIEVAFDLARIVIVPATEHNDGRFKVMVLDKSLFEDANNQIDTSFGAHTTWKEIHDQELVFKHPINRPARRNLFFHFVTSLLRRELYEAPDWFKDVDEVADFNNMWASPGAYLRRSTLQHLLNRIGKTATDGPLQKNAEQWLKACFDEKAPTPPDDEDPSTSEQRMADEIFDNQIISPARSRTESEEDQDEE